MECKLGRLPYAYEVQEYTGLTTQAVTRRLNEIDFYPKSLMISVTEKRILDCYDSCKTKKELAKIANVNIQTVYITLLKLRDLGLIYIPSKDENLKATIERKRKQAIIEKYKAPLKPLPTRRMWQRDPASGMIGGIL
jgi:DNA-binding CsgD family transcriptional regulator